MSEAPAAEPFDGDQQNVAALVVAASRFARAASRHSGRERSPIVLRTLSNLFRGGPQRIGDLAALEHITQPTMTGVIQRLEAEELVERSADLSDARVSLIGITEQGRVVLEDFRQRAAERVDPLLQQLTPEQRRTLEEATELMARLTSELDD